MSHEMLFVWDRHLKETKLYFTKPINSLFEHWKSFNSTQLFRFILRILVSNLFSFNIGFRYLTRVWFWTAWIFFHSSFRWDSEYIPLYVQVIFCQIHPHYNWSRDIVWFWIHVHQIDLQDENSLISYRNLSLTNRHR